MKDLDRAVAFLKQRGAAEIAHLGGDLLTHLLGTYDLLRAWGSAEALCLAGLCHAAYGTDGFPASLIDLSRRSDLASVIGRPAEELVYLYASCDRSYVHPRIGRRQAAEFRDRFTGARFAPPPDLFRSFLDLTFANELQIARGNADFLARNRESLEELFLRCEGLVSDAAYDCFVATLRRPQGSARPL